MALRSSGALSRTTSSEGDRVAAANTRRRLTQDNVQLLMHGPARE